MKTIKQPNTFKTYYALIPIPIICVLQLFFPINKWVWLLTIAATLVLYCGLMTYQ